MHLTRISWDTVTCQAFIGFLWGTQKCRTLWWLFMRYWETSSKQQWKECFEIVRNDMKLVRFWWDFCETFRDALDLNLKRHCCMPSCRLYFYETLRNAWHFDSFLWDTKKFQANKIPMRPYWLHCHEELLLLGFLWDIEEFSALGYQYIWNWCMSRSRLNSNCWRFYVILRNAVN